MFGVRVRGRVDVRAKGGSTNVLSLLIRTFWTAGRTSDRRSNKLFVPGLRLEDVSTDMPWIVLTPSLIEPLLRVISCAIDHAGWTDPCGVLCADHSTSSQWG